MTLVALLVAGCRKQAGSDTPASVSPSVSASQQAETVNNDSLVQVTEQQDTIEVPSAKMGRAITNMVFVPEQYLKGGAERYPVLYLLHGADDNYMAWSNHVDLKQKATQHGIIIVCPDGQDSWYFVKTAISGCIICGRCMHTTASDAIYIHRKYQRIRPINNLLLFMLINGKWNIILRKVNRII